MGTTRKILIAEDSAVLGDVIRFNLQRSGFDVTLARNGDEASHLLTQKSFDILVTDYEMPGLNGEELCGYARFGLHLDALQIIMCTARGYELKRDDLQSKFNIERFLYKPFSIRELVALLESLEAKSAVSTTSTF